MSNIFTELRQDHEIQRGLLERLLQTSGESDGREALFARLREQLQCHARLEEKHFYSHLLGEELSAQKARHSVAEHQELDDCLETLESTDMRSSAWLLTARKLGERLLHHLDEEEHEVFQIAGKVLSDSAKARLGGSYRREMNAEARDEAA